MNQQQIRFNIELTSVRDQLQESETHKDILQREVIIIKYLYYSILY